MLPLHMKSEIEIVQEAFDLGWNEALETAERAIGMACLGFVKQVGDHLENYAPDQAAYRTAQICLGLLRELRRGTPPKKPEERN